MSSGTLATEVSAHEHIETTNKRRIEVAVSGAMALVAGMVIWFLGSRTGYDGSSTGMMVGIFIASIGSVFFFPALLTYLLARR